MRLPRGSELDYKPEIDGLRALAVVAVVLYHAVPEAVPGGFVGVDVFFVISGYLITALLAGELQRTGRISFGTFYVRRARRLLPALVALVLGVMVLMVVLLGRHESLVDETAVSSLASLAFVSNFYFQWSSGGYFDAAADVRPMLHLWSLSVEEQFYLLYPLLLLGLLKLRPRAPRRRLALIAIASLLLAEYWVHILPDLAFYQMPARFWELAAGALVALSPAPVAPRGRDRWLLPAGVLLVLVAFVFSASWGPFPGRSALPAVVGASLVLLAVHWRAVKGATAALLRSRPFVFVGLVSYSFYLWHWPLLVMADQARPEPASQPERLLVCAIALGVAWASWRWVEEPFRRRPPGQPARILRSGIFALAATAGLVLALANIDRLPQHARGISEHARTDWPSVATECHFDVADSGYKLPPESCTFRRGKAPSLALWGDSHAMAWRPFVLRLAEQADGSAVAFTRNACPPAIVDPDVSNGALSGCARFNARVLAWLVASQPDTLVVAQRWPVGLAPNGPAPAVLLQRVDDLAGALQHLSGVRRILVIGPLPALQRPAPDCIALGWDRACAADAVAHRRRVERTWREIEVLASRFENVELIDPTDYFCDAIACPPSRRGTGLYWDTNHVTASAADGFARDFLADPSRYTRRSDSAVAVPGKP